MSDLIALTAMQEAIDLGLKKSPKIFALLVLMVLMKHRDLIQG